MKTYIVKKDFLDRFNNRKHMKPGDEHTPHDQDRADLLLSQGFIGPILEPPEPVNEEEKTEPEKEKPKRKPRTNKADKNDVSDDDESGKAE